MNYLKIKFGLFSLLAILATSVFLTSCEQEITETIDIDSQEFKVKESYTVYAEDAFSLEELINLEDATARQNFVDNINSTYEIEIESRLCGSWSMWYSTGYPCEYYRWKHCTGPTQYQFACFCSAYPAC